MSNEKNYGDLFTKAMESGPGFRHPDKALLVEEVKTPKLGGGGRLNDDKIRYDLLEPYAIEQIARIFTKGAKKYPSPPHNWLYGMKWSKMIASGARHVAAFLRGEDYDFYPDTCEGCKKGTCTNHTGELHVAQAAWNYLALTSYYKWFPQGDDRLHLTIPKPRIALDIDEVICNWVEAWANLHEINIPSSWYFQWDIIGLFDNMAKEGLLDKFYSELTPRFLAEELPFEPVAYISHRPVPDTVTKTWLEKHNFPLKPVYHVKDRNDKVQVAKDLKIDIFVDDNFDTFQAMNQAGICCFLMDALHNRRYDVGYRRITSLKQLPEC